MAVTNRLSPMAFSSPTSGSFDALDKSQDHQHETASEPDLDLHADENAGSGGYDYRKFAFTPTRLTSQPRAWDRKPSVPFLRRNGAQKIWHRVPLKTIANTSTKRWRRTQEGRPANGIMRPVKRVKMTNTAEDSGGVAVKWDGELEKSPKRKEAWNFWQEQDGGGSSDEEDEEVTLLEGDSTASIIDPRLIASTVTLNVPCFKEQTLQTDDERHDDAAQLDSRDDSEKMQVDEVVSAATPETHSIVSDAQSDSRPTDPISICFDLSGPAAIDFGGDEQSQQNTPIQNTAISTSDEEPIVDPVIQSAPSAATEDHDDDTTFLQGFLSRARAQKAAKVQPAQTFAEEKQQEGNIAPRAATFSGNPLDTPFPNLEQFSDSDDGEEGERTDQGERPASSSPTRRSTRTSATRLPRLQRPVNTISGLPNNISLRRLNGTEFIALQKESQNLAMTTRANTKRNKGSSVAVKFRLIQLQTDSLGAAVEGGRKRKGQGKSVVWAQKIARFRDLEGLEGDMLDIEPVGEQEEAGVQWEQKDEKSMDTASTSGTSDKQTKSTESASSETSAPENKERTSSRRVRKQRKENVGCENGTPAPKRTMEMMVDAALKSNDSKPDVKQTESHAATHAQKLKAAREVPAESVKRVKRTRSR